MSTTTKKVPLRKCIGCGEMKSKKDMIRVLRASEGDVILDRTGRQNGRGAYLCSCEACLEMALKTKGLERSLKTSIPPEVIENLKKELSAVDEK